MESEVQIRCQKKDVSLVEAVKDSCVKEFQEMVKKDCRKDIKCNLTIDHFNPLDDKSNSR